MGPGRKPLLVLLLTVLIPSTAPAQWATNGNPVCTATNAQDNVQIAPNGIGGAVMVWRDNRAGGPTNDIYARSINFLGPPEWTGNGIALCTATGNQFSPQVVYDDNTHNLHYIWEDQRGSDVDLYAAITDRSGNLLTPVNGFALSATSGDQNFASLTTNNAGMVYAAWADSRSGTQWDIYAQAFNYINHAFWPTNGLPICTASADQIDPAVAPDGSDGLYVAWEDLRNSNQYDIYAQHVNIQGQKIWATDGAVVCNLNSAQVQVKLASDGVGGVYIAWLDQRNGVNTDAIYAQHVNAAAVPLWTTNGIPLATSTNVMGSLSIIPDGTGGALLSWEDDRNGADSDIYAQRVTSGGSVLWGTNGVPVCAATANQLAPTIASDGTGGAVITWDDMRSGTADVYAQRINAAGSAVWVANGMVICNAANNQFNPVITKSDTGAVILAWEDRRTASIGDVYADRIDIGTGMLGHPQPYISSVVDVPNDEGGWVTITMQAPDEQPLGEEFTVTDAEYHGGDTVWLGSYNGSTTYVFNVLTEGVGVLNHYQVDYPYPSNIAVGTSIDNLAPPAPTLTGQRNGANVLLSWNSTAGDIQNYTVIRTDVGTLTTVTTTSYTDMNTPHTALHYRVHATDIHGNVGPDSNELVMPNPTGVDAISLGPSVLTVLPNSPNPFNSTSTFRFGMPRAGHAQLEIFDAAGRRVASRDLGEVQSGWRDLVLDGRDDTGHLLGSGVYFYRINAFGETRASKMVIQR